MSGDARRLIRNTFHEVTVGNDAERAVIDNGVARLVIGSRQVRFRDRQTDAVGEALAEWSSRELNAWRQAILRMTGCPATPLAELLDLLERQVVSGEVQQAVQQHASVPGRKHETIAVGPLRV